MAITINDVRFSYCNLFQPYTQPGAAEPKYSTMILVPKSNLRAKAAIDAAIDAAINAGVASKWGGQRPTQPALCVHDGDGPRPTDGMYGAEAWGCWVFNASSKQAPFVVDAAVQKIIDPTQVYSGMWGNVSVNFFAYNFSGKKGIGCGLNGVQKTRDGEPLAGFTTAEEAFTPVAGAAPAYQPAAPAYGQPAPMVDPITGQPYYPAGTPIMGL